jgi:hypothetical protein
VLHCLNITFDNNLSQLQPPNQDGTERYFRIQPTIAEANQALDNADRSNLQALKNVVAKTIQERSRQMDDLCAELAT